MTTGNTGTPPMANGSSGKGGKRGSRSGDVCRGCQEVGHWERECPIKRRLPASEENPQWTTSQWEQPAPPSGQEAERQLAEGGRSRRSVSDGSQESPGSQETIGEHEVAIVITDTVEPGAAPSPEQASEEPTRPIVEMTPAVTAVEPQEAIEAATAVPAKPRWRDEMDQQERGALERLEEARRQRLRETEAAEAAWWMEPAADLKEAAEIEETLRRERTKNTWRFAAELALENARQARRQEPDREAQRRQWKVRQGYALEEEEEEAEARRRKDGQEWLKKWEAKRTAGQQPIVEEMVQQQERPPAGGRVERRLQKVERLRQVATIEGVQPSNDGQPRTSRQRGDPLWEAHWDLAGSGPIGSRTTTEEPSRRRRRV